MTGKGLGDQSYRNAIGEGLLAESLRENWVIRAIATRVFPDLEAFTGYLDGLEKPSQLIDRDGWERYNRP